MRETWLITPARLLYWVFFKPLTLRAYQRQFGVKIDRYGDFSLLGVRDQLRTDPALRRYTVQMGVSLLLGFLPLLPLSVLAEMIIVAVTPDALFNWGNVVQNIALGVRIGVVLGVMWVVVGGVGTGVALGVAFGGGMSMAVSVAGGVLEGWGTDVVGGVALGLVAGVTFGVMSGVVLDVTIGAARGAAYGMVSCVMLGVVSGVVLSIVGGVASGVVAGVAFISMSLFFYFRLSLFMVYWPWNSLLYWLARNQLIDWQQLYRRCPQNWDELIWLRLTFLDGLLVLFTQADKTAGLAAIEEVGTSLHQGWAATRASERLLLMEMAQLQTVPELAAASQQLAWLPPTGPQVYREALERFCLSLTAAQAASSNLNKLTNLNRAQQTIRSMQAALDNKPQKQVRKKRGRPQMKEEISASSLDPQQLQVLMDQSFDVDELRQLSFAMGIDYEELPGSAKSKTAFSRELILYVTRQGQLPELITLLKQQRPLVFQESQLQQQIVDVPFQLTAEFRHELGRWGHILDEEINRLTQEETASPDIPNPYNPGLPLRPDGGSPVFLGRQDIFLEIELSLLSMNQPPTLLLHGPRRSGKTSLLYHLPFRLPDTIVPIFINLQAAAGTVQSAAGFVTALAEAIRDQAGEQRGVSLPRFSPRDFETEPYLSFANWLTQAERPLQGFTLLITFDEFEWVEKAIADGRLDESVLSFFRNLIQRGGSLRLALLFAGVHLLDEMKHNWASYFINVKTVHVGYLPEADARALILNPIDDFPLNYEPEALAAFLEQTHCQPYLIQLVAFDLINYLNGAERRAQGDWKTVTLADVQIGFQKGLQSGTNYFTERWQSCQSDEKRILASLAAGQGLPPEMDEGARLLALRRLERRELVEEVDGRYQIQIPLVARWIREEKPPALVRAEIRQQ